MKILVACEFSATVREAFAAEGHDAWSCDLEETEVAGQHITADVRKVLHMGWDLMIAHPPCTYLSNAGARWYRKPGRLAHATEAANFVLELWAAPVPKVAIENPVSMLSKIWQPPTQIIHPYQFGHQEQKTIWLWLRGLAPLVPTNVRHLDRRDHIMAMGPSFSRHKDRSRFFPGVARAMAQQWGAADQPALRAEGASA